jgi:FtsP/CotA-like multicopper oxidase with cupredoxin domain
MYKTPWSDGVGGLSQRPIQPGEKFVHQWTATNYGSYWYHAHERSQLEDGLYGPIIIHPKKEIPKPFAAITNSTAALYAMLKAEKKVMPLVLSDFRHATSQATWDVTVKAGFEFPCYDSVLINGKGSVRCRSKEEIEPLLSAEQQMLLGAFNASLTDKSCVTRPLT